MVFNKYFLRSAKNLDFGFSNQSNKENEEDFSNNRDVTEFSIMNRKIRSPISHQNLIHYYNGLQNMLENSDIQSSREYALSKLKEYDPIFRKFVPELFNKKLDL